MLDGADPLMPTSEAKLSPERALGILLLAMLAITVLLLIRAH